MSGEARRDWMPGDEPREWEDVAAFIWEMLRPDYPQTPGNRALLALAYTLARKEASS